MVHVERVERSDYGVAQLPAEAAPDSGEILNMAVQHHQAGRLDQADALYRLLLDVEPDFPDAASGALMLRCRASCVWRTTSRAKR